MKTLIKPTFTRRNPVSTRYISVHPLAKRMDIYLEGNFYHTSLRLDDLCSHFSISHSYASIIFQKSLGTTFRKRLAYYRIQQAKKLIISTDDPLYIIAEKCGFTDYRRLTESFRRTEGIPPKMFRQNFKDLHLQ